MATALDVARHLIKLAAAEEEPEFLSHLKLQKLLYYVQGWSLALRNKPMFDARIEAWSSGPVVRSLYAHFADYGYRPIPPDDVGEAVGLSGPEKFFIGSVWEALKGYSASSLRAMTHKEAPWLDARKGLAPAERSNREITRSALKRFFSQQAE